MAVAQRPHASSGSDWHGLEHLEMRSKPCFSNVQEPLPSIHTIFSTLASQEKVNGAEYRHNTASFSPVMTERTYNTSPESNKRRISSNSSYDDEIQQQRGRYQSVSSSRSPMTYHHDSGAASPVGPIARRESLRSIPERRAPFSDHTSRPPFHSPISEPSSTIYRQNLPGVATKDRSYDRPYHQIPAGHSHDYPRSEYSLEACRPYQQHNYAPAHDTSYAPSQSDYGYQQPRNQAYPGHPPYQLNQGQTPFTEGHHSGNYSSAAYQAQDMDSKPRKRRGNLPKPTTDILTTWFINHLEHPYPNEEEKQLLMVQTGLHLNQISNWFINARRRKLPALQNNARAENAARSHHNRMHSADDEQSPMSLCNSDAGLSPRDASTFNEGWSSRQEERHNQHHY
ncbi:hypothetical protein SS1G_08681 [Sclerotinia sclerotiorum 1980 UF-70]|uniref:Homeobox domain-containing protein n=2 Tax=Sclerotinia sclerotiorum (strain ATCC 18683 / 1980 / Ss-1) TaxID=665079 RepID=A7ETM4_SCLS1|nr:hypothetical protein SS1G_08681 [Sclerotinia sclerotiorum 1980 UF-70]APA15106.1 hypothetical protein sscle_14g098760 [Sclerotinia sclerotiorum 1980 UF-70]EDN92816.1 hypothetical protein SS1G_08681 [Sclerotinia sclerotiorum 1980 UF-70]